MYFEGQGTQENWYLGYYHWREGLALADGPEWGSCAEDNFVFGDRYHYESQRKKAVDDRIYQLSPGEISTIEEAWDYPDTQRLGYLASLPFSKPVSPTAAIPQATTPVGYDWAPLTGGICQMSGSSHALARSEMFRLRSGAIWTLSSTKADGARTQGSAVAVSSTQLVTNCHLIGNPQDVLLRQEDFSLRGSVVSSDPGGDRCILEVEQAVPIYVASARKHGALMVGEDVLAIGNPKGLDATLSRGIIAQKRVKAGHTYIQTDAAISSGSSGGGLFDTAGNLVGITTFKIAEGESLNFAIAIDEFCQP